MQKRYQFSSSFRAFTRILWISGAVFAYTMPPAFAERSTIIIPEAQTFAGAYLAGRSAERDSDFVSAVDLYQQAVGLDPDSDIVLQRLFLAELIVGDMDGALLIADDVAQVQPIANIVNLTKATEAVRAKKYKSAIALMAIETESDLDRLLAGIITAWSEFGAGNREKALASIAALEGPEWFGHFKALTSAYMSVLDEKPQAALGFFQTAMDDRDGGSAARDSYVRGLEAYLRFVVRQGNADKIAEVRQLVEEVTPNSPIFIQLIQQIDRKEALKNSVGSVQDGVAEVLYGLGMAINQPGSETFVSRFLTQANHLRPNAEIIAFEQAEIYERLGLDELAAAKWESIEETSPIWRLAQIRLGIVLNELDRSDEAKERLQRTIALDPKDIAPYLVLGRLHAGKEDYRSAATLYDSALEQDLEGPQLWTLHYQRGIAYERIKEWEKAEPSFREALKLQPNQPQVMNYLGYSLIDMDLNLVEGLELVRDAVAIARDDGAIADSLGWAYFKLGRFDEAVAELERAIQILPGDPVINDHLGDAYWVVGRQNEGRFQWSTALDLEPTPEDRIKIQEKLKNGLTLPANLVPKQKMLEQPADQENIDDAADAKDDDKA